MLYDRAQSSGERPNLTGELLMVAGGLDKVAGELPNLTGGRLTIAGGIKKNTGEGVKTSEG
ncbi:MAG: hypothetical protein JEZ14_16585 [Marinilabiliaceae bacterium]|nr:hypothetical protein [Marinilabiliaceae bacterium]